MSYARSIIYYYYFCFSKRNNGTNMDSVKIFICCTVHSLCSDHSTSKGLEFKSSGRRFTYIHIQIKFYFVKKKKKFIRWSMCVKQPMVNWRFLNEKKKKEKGINWQIQKWQPISKDINEWKTQRWERGISFRKTE